MIKVENCIFDPNEISLVVVFPDFNEGAVYFKNGHTAPVSKDVAVEIIEKLEGFEQPGETSSPQGKKRF